MVYALSWLVVALGLAAWSFLIWLLHALATWTLTTVGRLGEAGAPDGTVPPLPESLVNWVPAEWLQALQSSLEAIGPLVQQVLEAAPLLSGGITVLAWLVWGAGALLLGVLGAVLHGLVAWWRRQRRAPLVVPAAPRPLH